MNYGALKKTDIANGLGVRVSLFVSGCAHRCPGCFNEVAWSFDYGTPYTAETEQEIIDALRPPYIRGLSLLGGEPFEAQNQKTLVTLLRRVREELPEKDVWCYSGFLFEELTGELPSRARTDVTDEMLSMLDVLVDGRFVEAEKDISLRFRGSRNQRILDVPQSLASGKAVDYRL